MPSERHPRRLAVLVSGGGSNLAALLSHLAAAPTRAGEVVVVGSDQPDAGGLLVASDAGIPAFELPLERGGDRQAWEAALADRLATYEPDAVVLAGFMRILSGRFLARWPHAVINTHPSLLPAFRGARAVADALDHGVKVTGCTVHLVDEEVDHGPIIAQEAVPVFEDDDESSLHERIKAVEHRLLPACVEAFCRGQLRVDGRRVHLTDAAQTDHARSE